MYSPETQSKIATYRQKALDGTLTLDECRESIKLLREGRETAQAAAKASKSRAKPPVSADALLNELDSL